MTPPREQEVHESDGRREEEDPTPEAERLRTEQDQTGARRIEDGQPESRGKQVPDPGGEHEGEQRGHHDAPAELGRGSPGEQAPQPREGIEALQTGQDGGPRRSPAGGREPGDHRAEHRAPERRSRGQDQQRERLVQCRGDGGTPRQEHGGPPAQPVGRLAQAEGRPGASPGEHQASGEEPAPRNLPPLASLPEPPGGRLLRAVAAHGPSTSESQSPGERTRPSIRSATRPSASQSTVPPPRMRIGVASSVAGSPGAARSSDAHRGVRRPAQRHDRSGDGQPGGECDADEPGDGEGSVACERAARRNERIAPGEGADQDGECSAGERQRDQQLVQQVAGR